MKKAIFVLILIVMTTGLWGFTLTDENGQHWYEGIQSLPEWAKTKIHYREYWAGYSAIALLGLPNVVRRWLIDNPKKMIWRENDINIVMWYIDDYGRFSFCQINK